MNVKENLLLLIQTNDIMKRVASKQYAVGMGKSNSWKWKGHRAEGMGPRRLSENALFPQLCVILKKLSSEYHLYACGNFFRIPWFEKKLLFRDSLLGDVVTLWTKNCEAILFIFLDIFENLPVENDDQRWIPFWSFCFSWERMKHNRWS